MFFKTYLVSGLLALGLFAYSQYQGWSIWGVNESKPQPGSTRSGYHK